MYKQKYKEELIKIPNVRTRLHDAPVFNPIDPNPAISAHAVFPQSGHIRPEKRPFFKNIPHFSKIKPCKKYEPLIGVQYIKLKLTENSITRKRNNLVLINQ